jgi:hypothetical protein
MAISFVAAGTVGTGSGGAVTVPVGYAEKDLLVIVATGTVTPATPAGWIRIGAQGAQPFITIFYKFASSTETTTGLSGTAVASTFVMLAYRGVSATDTISTFINGTGLTSISTNTLSATYADEYIISVYGSMSGAGTWTAPGSTTSRVNSSPTISVTGLLIVDELQAASGTSTARTATFSPSRVLGAVAISIIPSGRYWIGGTGTWNTSATTNWSFSSGGTSGAPVPTANDPVTFDQAATYTVTMTGALVCLDMTVSDGPVTFATGTTPTLAISGSMSLIAGTIWTSTGAITFNSTSTGRTITGNSVTIDGAITFNGAGGGWSLGSDFTQSSTTTLTTGALSLNNYNLSTNAFISTGVNAIFFTASL